MTTNWEDVASMEATIKNINLPPNSCNDPTCTTFDFSRFTELEKLEIGCFSFMNVKTFALDNMAKLKAFSVKKDSFSRQSRIGWNQQVGYNPEQHFSIHNCPQLDTVDIGPGSFSGFSGRVELTALPSLTTLVIGDVKESSYNFYHAQFVLKGC